MDGQGHDSPIDIGGLGDVPRGIFTKLVKMVLCGTLFLSNLKFASCLQIVSVARNMLPVPNLVCRLPKVGQLAI